VEEKTRVEQIILSGIWPVVGRTARGWQSSLKYSRCVKKKELNS